MRHRYPHPGNEDEFEDFCVRFYRQHLSRSGLVRYAKRGEKQDGIDIIDQLGLSPLVAVQCKNHEPNKTIPPQEIKNEVALAEASAHPIERYIIATTAKKSKNAQDAVLKLNRRPDELRKFTIEIYFWEDICTHLNEFGKAVAEFVVWGEQSSDELVSPIQNLGTDYLRTTEHSENASEASRLFPEIDLLFIERKLEAAAHEINKLPDAERDLSMEVDRRYAILRLQAKLALEQLRFDDAVRYFSLAHTICPELQQARQNHTFALELSGERGKAYDEAAKLLQEGIKTGFLLTLLIRNARSCNDLEPFQEAIDEFCATEEDVNLALVGQYLRWNLLECAETAALKAAALSPRSAHALYARGTVAHSAAFEKDWRDRRQYLDEAIEFYSDALAAAKRDHYAGLLPEILTNRARVHGVLGNLGEAGNDYQTAINLSDRPDLYAESAVSFFLHAQEYESAWELLPKLDGQSENSAFLIAVTEYHHAPDSEKSSHISALQILAEKEFDRATEARCHCVQWLIEAKDFAAARSCVSSEFLKRQPFQGNTLLAWIEFEAKNIEGAHELAARALDSSSRSAQQQEIAVLARLLTRLGEDEKALPLFVQAATQGVLDESCKSLLDCAQRLNRHDTLMNVCSELRQSNQQDDLVRRLEVQLLSHYAPETAFQLAKEFQDYERPYFTAARNFLAVRLRKLNEIELGKENLPMPGDLSPDEGYLVVTPYVEMGHYADALQFVFDQLRKHFSVEQAHGQYIWMMMQYGKKAGISDSQTVDQQSAVHLENLTTGQKRWITIESNAPDSSRFEFAGSDPVVQSLLGRRCGDVVDIRGPSIQQQREKIIEVQSKYVRLFQDAMENFQHRFPGAGTIQSVHLGDGQTFDLTPLIESHEQRRDHVENALAFYRDKLCSLHTLAAMVGTNVRTLMTSLGDDDQQFIRCVESTPRDFLASAQSGIGSGKIVLDLSAIVTISRLNAWDDLSPDYQYLTSRGTFDTISEWLHESEKQNGQAAGTSFLTDDGNLCFREHTPEALQGERDELGNLVSKLDAIFEVKSSMAISELEPKRRKTYIDVVGFPTLEALGVAKEENAVIWTDDLFVGMIAAIDFGTTRIWSQLAFNVFEKANHIDKERYSQISAKLAAWNYVQTVWHPEDVIAAGDLSDWDSKAWPFAQCIALIGSCTLPPSNRARLMIDLFRLLRRSSCIELRQSTIVQALLDSLDNVAAVEWMFQRIDQFFSIDYPTAKFLKYELSYWLRLR